MNVVEIGTEHLPPRERFDYWTDLIFRSHTRSALQVDDRGDFLASSFVLDLAVAVVSAQNIPEMRADRNTKLIRQSDPEAILLQLARNCSGRVSQGKLTSIFKPGEIVVYNTSEPLRVDICAGGGRADFLIVEVSRAMLESLVPSLPKLMAVPFSGRSGVGAVLSRYLDELLRNAFTYRPTDAVALGGVALDLVAAACTHRLTAGSVPIGQRAMLVSVKAFIERHLNEQRLAPEMIAAAHHISVRQLHKLFQDLDGPSVAGWIRHRRLERCRRDLANPLLCGQAISVIAARWAFADPSHFSRSFREAYGFTPSDFRRTQPDTR